MNRNINLLIPLLLSGTAIAQSTGMFTPTGSMISPRANHTATLLHNGKVLVTGGSFLLGGKMINTVLSGAELYDPGTGTFAGTGNMSAARVGHTATLLTNGQVLITGGNHPHRLASAELYDPSIGSFTPTGSMTIGRVGHTATLLRNGQVLITGGDNGGFCLFVSAEIYDPSTGTFTATESMNMPRVGHTATLLSNGKVLVDAGEGGFGASAEIYDPATGTFSQTGGTTYYPSYLSSGSTSLLPDGKVLLTWYSHRVCFSFRHRRGPNGAGRSGRQTERPDSPATAGIYQCDCGWIACNTSICRGSSRAGCGFHASQRADSERRTAGRVCARDSDRCRPKQQSRSMNFGGGQVSKTLPIPVRSL